MGCVGADAIGDSGRDIVVRDAYGLAPAQMKKGMECMGKAVNPFIPLYRTCDTGTNEEKYQLLKDGKLTITIPSDEITTIEYKREQN